MLNSQLFILSIICAALILSAENSKAEAVGPKKNIATCDVHYKISNPFFEQSLAYHQKTQGNFQAKHKNLAAVWIIRAVYEVIKSFATGKMGEILVCDGLLNDSIIESNSLQQLSLLQSRNRSYLQNFYNFFSDAKNYLCGNNYSQDTKRGLLQGLIERYKDLETQLNIVERSIIKLEEEQGRQHREIIEINRKIGVLDERVTENEKDIKVINKKLSSKKNQINKYDGYFSGSIFYTNTFESSIQNALGGNLSLQINPTSWLGVFTSYLFIPLSANGSTNVPNESKAYWTNHSLIVGGTISPVPPQKMISLNLGLGAGIALNRLIYLPNDDPVWFSENSRRIDSITNLAYYGKFEIGIAPLPWKYEPFFGIGAQRFANSLESKKDTGVNIDATDVWLAYLGLRYRFDYD